MKAVLFDIDGTRLDGVTLGFLSVGVRRLAARYRLMAEHDAETLRAMASRARLVAETSTDPELRQLLLDTAADYESWAAALPSDGRTHSRN